AANILRNIVPVYIMCDPADIRAVPMVRAPFSQRPTLYLYDNYPGGIGLSFKLFNNPLPALEASLDLVQRCGCEAGCPSCVGPLLEVGEKAKAHSPVLFTFLLDQLQNSPATGELARSQAPPEPCCPPSEPDPES
ncbi:MAG: DUF1998 domain-containing protein, partial [Calditrichaeota bacterium]